MWITIVSWHVSNDRGVSETGGAKQLAAGYNSRVYVTSKVYNESGSVIETVNKYSATKAY